MAEETWKPPTDAVVEESGWTPPSDAIEVKKKEPTEPSTTISGSSSTPVQQQSKPLLPNGEVDFLAQANKLTNADPKEEQFQQTGSTGRDDLKAKQTKLATKQLEKDNIQTEAAKYYNAIEDNSQYPLMGALKDLYASPEENKLKIEEIRNTPVSDDWRKAGSIQVSETQTLPVPNLKKSAYKTYGEMWDATQKASEQFGALKEKVDLLDAELIPAIQQKRNEAAYIPDGKDEYGNEYMKLNPMQSFVEGFGGSVDAIGLGLKKLNPLYSREELKNDLKVKYLRDNVLFPKKPEGTGAELTGMLGGVTPLILSGGTGATGYGALAVNALTFGTMDLGGGMYEGFAEGKAKGMSDDEAMDFADKIGIEKGVTGTVLGATMPMQSALGRKIFINKAEAGALKTFLAEQGVMVPTFMSKTLIDNLGAKAVGSERDLTEGVAESGASAFIIGAMTHAIATIPKLPKATKDIFENTIAKNYTSLNGVISKAVSDGAIDFSTSQRIAEKAKAFEAIGKDLAPKQEAEQLPIQIEIDNLEKQKEGKTGLVKDEAEQRIDELTDELKEKRGSPLSNKEQKEYETILAKEEQTPAEGKPKPKLTDLEKARKKHFEKRIKTAEKKAAKIEEEQLKKETNKTENTLDIEASAEGAPKAEERIESDATEGETVEPKQVAEDLTDVEANKFIDDHAVQGKIQKSDYRPNFGLSSEELTRGLEQIKKGQTDKVAAKRVLDKIAEWKRQGYVDMLAGGGGAKSSMSKVSVPFEVMKEASELSDVQLQRVGELGDAIDKSSIDEVVEKFTDAEGNLDRVKLAQELADAKGKFYFGDLIGLSEKELLNLQTLLTDEKSGTTVEIPDTTSSSKVKFARKSGEEQSSTGETEPTQEVTPIGKEVSFKHAGQNTKGIVTGVDAKGNLLVTEKGRGKYPDTKHVVKKENATFEKTAEQVQLQDKNDALLNDIRTSLTPKKAVKPKEEADNIVKMGVPGTQQLADLPNKLFQNVLAEKVVRPLEDYVAKTIQKASVSSNKAKRTIADFMTSFSRGVVDTQEYSKDKRQFTGEINTAKLEAEDMHEAMWDLIGGDLNAADRVHQVLDPELRGTGLTYADLTSNEQQLFDLLRKINNYTHNENFLIDRISQETFDKFKDKYIGREYDYEMSYDPQIGKPLKEILGIYKQRGDVDLEKQLHAIKDPIYLTLRRFLQTGQNKAIVEYADLLHEQYGSGNAQGNEPLVLTKAEAKDREGFVELGKGFGKLSHKFVARHVAEDFKGFTFNNAFIQMAYDLNRVYDGLAPRQWMKELLTVGNPQVQLGNFTSNVIFSWMGGVDMPTYLSKLPEAIKQINERGTVYRDLVKEGLLKTDFVSADLKPMQTTLGAPQSKNIAVKGREKLRSLYGGADDAAKIQMYLSLKDMGYTHEQSVNTIFESLQNYQNTGRVWDFASKTPIVGNAFVKFTPEMLRMLKNGATRRPLHTMALIGMLYAMPKLIGKYFGNDDDEIEAAGRQKGIPKIMIPYTDLSIPLSWRVGDKRVNIARYMMPMYQYDIGGENKVATDFANKFIPYGIKTTEEGGIEPSVSDPFVAPVISVIRNKDFRDKQIAEETDNAFDKTLKRLRYIGRGYGGWYAGMVDDIFSTTLTGEDFYGRRKTATDIALNTLIKIETFDDARLKEGIEREFDGYGRATNSLYSAYTKKRKALQSDLEQVQSDSKMDASRKKELTERAERKLQHLANNVLEDIAEIQEKQLEATELYRNLSRKQPYSDLEKHFKETEKEIAQIENRIDGKFKVASSSRKRKRR
jgi:hypothetical protein